MFNNNNPSKATPAFKFVIKSKIEATTATTTSKPTEEKVTPTNTSDDRKRKRTDSSSSAPLATKKIHSQLAKWNKKKEELKIEGAAQLELEQARANYLDIAGLTCLLCQRKFKQKPDLFKHQALSDLHKTNLADPVTVSKATLKLNFLKPEEPKEAEQAVEYRNRAAERRQAYGQPERPVLSPPSSPPRQPSRELMELPKASMHVPIADDNKGARMLQNMGWKKGEGLGKDGTGILAPVKAESYAQSAGIGASTRREVDGSYRDRTRDVARQRLLGKK